MAWVAAIGALIGAGVGLYQSWEASEAAKKLDEDTKRRVSEALKIYEQNVKMPDMDRTPLTQEQLTLLGKYTPNVAQYIQEKNPEMVTEQASADVISKQKQALEQYQQLSQTGEDALARSQRERGMSEAEGAQRKATEQILRAYQQQGIGGGGQELLATQNAGQQAANSRRQLSLDIAAQNQQRRMEALNQMANLSGQVRNQNQNVEQANVSAINAFNQRNAQTKQAWENAKTNEQNRADLYNMEQKQRIADTNTDIRNKTYMANRARNDMIEAANRNAANDINNTRLNAATGRATADRTMGQDELARKLAMQQQAIAGVTAAGSAYASGQEKQADREARYGKPAAATPQATTETSEVYDLDTKPIEKQKDYDPYASWNNFYPGRTPK